MIVRGCLKSPKEANVAEFLFLQEIFRRRAGARQRKVTQVWGEKAVKDALQWILRYALKNA
jgi:hypothetical protein